MPLNKMLLPTAIKDKDSKLLSYACALTAQGVRELVLAHVVDATGQEAPVLVREVDRAYDKLHEMVEPSRGQGMNIEVRVVTGSVFREIMALANQADVDVIVCGTEGKSFVDYLFSGSVSEDIALKGDERTMTVRWSLLDSVEGAHEMGRSFAERLVVPTDFSSSSLRALLSAFDRPKEALGELHVVHVVSDPSERLEAEMQMRAVHALGEEHEANVKAVILEGDPSEVVLDYLQRIDATGVITGRRGKSRLKIGVLGSVSMDLLQRANCPVVVQP